MKATARQYRTLKGSMMRGIVRAAIIILACASGAPSVGGQRGDAVTPDDPPMQLTLTNYAANVRARLPDFDRWNVADLPRMQQADFELIRVLAAGSQRVWQSEVIPAPIRRQYGDEAVPIMMRLAFERTTRSGAPRDSVGYVTTSLLGGLIRRFGELGDTIKLDLDSPITMQARDGTIIRATLADALNHYIARAILDSPDSATAYTVIVGIPGSIIRGLMETNPQVRDKLARIKLVPALLARPLRSGEVVPMVSALGIRLTPTYAYESGQASNAGLSASIFRRGVTNVNPRVVCPNLRLAEIDIYDAQPDDITMANAWTAGALRNAIGRSGCGDPH